MSDANGKKIAPPPGAYVELDLTLIDEGNFKTLAEQKIKQALEGLLQYEKESGDLTAGASVTIKIKMERQTGSQQFMDISYSAKTEVPVVTRATQTRLAGDKLLCQPAGSNQDSPDQQLFYDGRGNIICDGNGVAPDHAGVAGKIKPAANA